MAKITNLKDFFAKEDSAPDEQLKLTQELFGKVTPSTLKGKKEKFKTLAEAQDSVKGGMTFNSPNISNISVRTTQYERYVFANEMAHKKTTDATLPNGRKIRFEGTRIEPGKRVFEVVSDGLDPLLDQNYSTDKGTFSVKMGKVSQIIDSKSSTATEIRMAQRIAQIKKERNIK